MQKIPFEKSYPPDWQTIDKILVKIYNLKLWEVEHLTLTETAMLLQWADREEDEEAKQKDFTDKVFTDIARKKFDKLPAIEQLDIALEMYR